MTSTLSRPPVRAPRQPGIRFEVARAHRRPLLAVGSVALVAASTALFTSLYIGASHQTPVLSVSRNVPQGAELGPRDLSVVSVSVAGGITPIPAARVGGVLGRRVAVPLLAGTLLTRAELLTASAPLPGDAVVGVGVSPGQLPAAGVLPGQSVDVVLTAPPGSPDSSIGSTNSSSVGATSAGSGAVSGSLLASSATVTDVTVPSSSSTSEMTIVSLMLPSTLAPLVANASAAGQVALVLVAPES